jgi:hypothetical protein
MCKRLLPVAPTLSEKRNKETYGDIKDNIHNEILRSSGGKYLNFIQENYERKIKVHFLCP